MVRCYHSSGLALRMALHGARGSVTLALPRACGSPRAAHSVAAWLNACVQRLAHLHTRCGGAAARESQHERPAATRRWQALREVLLRLAARVSVSSRLRELTAAVRSTVLAALCGIQAASESPSGVGTAHTGRGQSGGCEALPTAEALSVAL